MPLDELVVLVDLVPELELLELGLTEFVSLLLELNELVLLLLRLLLVLYWSLVPPLLP